MRVLFAANPARTIFLPMVPLAWALRTAGHEVRFASQPGFADEITQAGLTAVPVGRDLNYARLLRASGLNSAIFEQGRAGLGEPWDAVDDPAKATWDYLKAGVDGAVQGWHRASNFPIIADLVDFARHWQPDLVIWEPLTYAGSIAAKACGAAHARILWGMDVYGGFRELYRRLNEQQPPEDRADPMADWLAGYGRKYGFEFSEDMLTGHFTIDQFPPSLQLDAGLHYLRMQYVPYGGPSVVPKWLWAPPERPRVALTMGLSATDKFAGYTFNLQDVLDALADLDIEIVATIAESEQKKLVRIPDNAHLVPFVPLHALAPTCSVVIHHAGAATLATAALHHVPQLALGYHWDEPIIARKLAAQGGALELDPGQATGRNVRDSVLRLLHEPAFRDGAARLTNEIRALPTPNQLVPQLEELTTKHRTTVR